MLWFRKFWDLKSSMMLACLYGWFSYSELWRFQGIYACLVNCFIMEINEFMNCETSYLCFDLVPWSFKRLIFMYDFCYNDLLFIIWVHGTSNFGSFMMSLWNIKLWKYHDFILLKKSSSYCRQFQVFVSFWSDFWWLSNGWPSWEFKSFINWAMQWDF